jgi:CheY-like chemotaxis protein
MQTNSPLVLVVDDAADSRELYAEMLRKAGYRVLQAADGVDGLAMAFAEMPSLVVMDLWMPDLDGWEATRRLKADARTRDIPVVVLTGAGLGAQTSAAEAGCDLFLVKPCFADDLVGVVGLELLKRRGSDPGA